MGIHWQELVIILVIALVIFGPRRLPEIGRSLGGGFREFKDGLANGTKIEDTPIKAAVPVEAPATIEAPAITKDSGPSA